MTTKRQLIYKDEARRAVLKANPSDVNCIDRIKPVDAVEVVHARWEEIGVADYKCSRCGFRFTSADSITMFQYCRCGAKMDGGNKND